MKKEVGYALRVAHTGQWLNGDFKPISNPRPTKLFKSAESAESALNVERMHRSVLSSKRIWLDTGGELFKPEMRDEVWKRFFYPYLSGYEWQMKIADGTIEIVRYEYSEDVIRLT